jgi:TPR repeat protein
MTTEVLRSLDIPVLLNNHHETFSTHTIPEATGMTRITLNIFDVTPLRAVILAAVLSFMAFTPLVAQDLQKGGDAYNAGDYATALQEWTPLAEAGNVSAQFNLGVMYENGQGVLQDYAEAVRLYRLAADQGFANAQTNLGVMYRDGLGVPQDYAEAVRLYRLAADQGFANAQTNLGYMYSTGQGVLQDYAEAVRLYRLAADQGFANAQTNLGYMYENGLGVPQDKVMAHMWYNISAANGNELGRANRDGIAEFMTQQAIEQAQAMARECMGSGYQNCGY